MRTLIAVYPGDEPTAQIVEAVHNAGLDGQNILVIGRDEQGEPVAHSGPQQTVVGQEGRSLHAFSDDGLRKLLVAEYGEGQAAEMLQAARDGQTIIIVHVENYLLEATRQALQAGNPASLTERELAFQQDRHPSPQPETLDASPQTADFYSAQELDPHQHTFDRGVDFDTRHSPFHDHYSQTYAPKGWPFERVVEAYQFGAAMRGRVAAGVSWEAAEAELRERWLADRSSEVPWEDIREAVRHIWSGGRI